MAVWRSQKPLPTNMVASVLPSFSLSLSPCLPLSATLSPAVLVTSGARDAGNTLHSARRRQIRCFHVFLVAGFTLISFPSAVFSPPVLVPVPNRAFEPCV